jgi:hypothetical protein
MERDFKGVFIPKDVWLNKDLSALDKIIYAEIDSLDNEDTGCYASNEYLAEFCCCSISKVSKAISKLIKLGYITISNFNGRQRVMRVLQGRLVKNARQTSKKCQADLQKMPTENNNIDNIIESNKYNKDQIEKEFFKLWSIYPRKEGKKKALSCYIKARKSGTTFEQVEKGIQNYLAHLKRNSVDKKYIKQGSTFFNGECWNDEYEDTSLFEKKQENLSIVEMLNRKSGDL